MFRPLTLYATISEIICRPSSVGTENPEIKVDLHTATMTVFIQPLSATKNHVTPYRYTPEIPDIYVLQQII